MHFLLNMVFYLMSKVDAQAHLQMAMKHWLGASTMSVRSTMCHDAIMRWRKEGMEIRKCLLVLSH